MGGRLDCGTNRIVKARAKRAEGPDGCVPACRQNRFDGVVARIGGVDVARSIQREGVFRAQGKLVGVIFNISRRVSDKPSDLKHYAEIESEIAWQATPEHLPATSEIHYYDIVTETVRVHKASLRMPWRDIATTADNTILAYDAIIARRKRDRRNGGLPTLPLVKRV
jgi:3-methyladenine DNA glycosylase Tag